MTTVAIRKKIHQYIDAADNGVLKLIHFVLIEIYKNKKISEPMSLEEYNASIERAEKEVAEGKYLPHKEAIKQIREW